MSVRGRKVNRPNMSQTQGLVPSSALQYSSRRRNLVPDESSNDSGSIA